MKTMFKVEEMRSTDWENIWDDRTNGYVATINEAMEIAETIEYKDAWNKGIYRIIARTIDEEAFTVVDEIIYEKNDEIEKIENHIENQKRIIKAKEEAIARSKSEKNIERHKAEIERYEASIVNAEMLKNIEIEKMAEYERKVNAYRQKEPNGSFFYFSCFSVLKR